MSEHSPLSWFPFDVAEWTSSPAISMMLPEQEGAYLRLLLAAWGKGDAEPSLPTDAMQLAQTSKLGARWKKLSPLILAQFEERNGRLVSARQVTMWWSQQQKHAAAVTKATTAAKARHAKKAAPSMPQADLELPPGILEGRLLSRENLDSTASPSTPNGVEREKHVPAADAGLAPAGAAPADVAAERTNGTGDYLDNPRTREEFIRRGLLRGDDVIPPAPDAAALLDSLAEQQRRDAAHFAAVKAAAWRWMRANPTDAKAMGAELRAALGLPLEQPVTGLRADTLEAEMIGAISARLQWPSADEWDGVTPIDSLTPLEPASC